MFWRQVVGVEDAVVDSNFADVMEGRGRRDEVAVHSAQAVDVGLLAQTLQQDAGDALHPCLLYTSFEKEMCKAQKMQGGSNP